MKTVSLEGKDWKLIYVKNSVLINSNIKYDVNQLRSIGCEISASVPGNLEIDLENAGKIEDPFYADNHRQRDCEYLHCFYTKEFNYDENFKKINRYSHLCMFYLLINRFRHYRIDSCYSWFC